MKIILVPLLILAGFSAQADSKLVCKSKKAFADAPFFDIKYTDQVRYVSFGSIQDVILQTELKIDGKVLERTRESVDSGKIVDPVYNVVTLDEGQEVISTSGDDKNGTEVVKIVFEISRADHKEVIPGYYTIRQTLLCNKSWSLLD